MDRSSIRALKNRVVLSDVVAPYVRLSKKGSELWGCCPFHQEKTPSFKVNNEKGVFHCFGCHKHGDVFTFLAEKRGLSFYEAAEELALKVGFDLPAREVGEAPQEARQEAELLKSMLAKAATFFAETLKADAGAGARSYLQKRGVSAAAAQTFLLGATHKKGFLSRALKDYTPAQLLKADLLQPLRQNTQAAPTAVPNQPSALPRESFYHRVMFPLRNLKGDVLGFGGRTFGDATPKYRNSAESPVFKKQYYLYGLFEARQNAALLKAPFLVVEGYLDVIALQSAGLARAVAPLGTALSQDQLVLAFKNSKTVYICFDGDTAGQNAAFKAAEAALPILKPDLSLRFCILPEGLDPHALIQSNQTQQLLASIESSRTLLDVLFDKALALFPHETPEAQAQRQQSYEKWCGLLPDYHLKTSYLRALRQRFYAHQRNPKAASLLKRSAPQEGHVTLLRQKIILLTLINHPSLLAYFVEMLATIRFDALFMPLQQGLLSFATNLDMTQDSETLQTFLAQKGLEAAVASLGSRHALQMIAPFVNEKSERQDAEKGLLDLFRTLEQNRVLRQEVKELERAFAKDGHAGTWERLSKLRQACLEQQDQLID